jgi:alpha-1,2-mannosyltransferase
MYDMRSYIAGARAILDGLDPYTVKSEFDEFFVYPPFALLLFLPIARLSWNAIALGSSAISIAALQASIWLALKQIGIKRLALLTTVVLLPIALVLFDLLLPDSSRFKGVLVGLCTGIKIIPGLFVAYYLLGRKFRAAWMVLITAASTVVLGTILFPRPSYDYWTRYVFETTRIAQQASWLPNESLRGMLARTLHSEEAAILPWLVLSIAVLAVALLITKYSIDLGEENLGIAAIALAGLLMSPVSWHHLWVWIIPIAIFTVDLAVREHSILLWSCAVVPVVVIALRMGEWFITDPYHLDSLALYGLQLFMSNIVNYTSLLLLFGFLAYLTLGMKHHKAKGMV